MYIPLALLVLAAQAPGHWPPDSLINVKVIPKNTPVMQVVGMMRNFAGALRERYYGRAAYDFGEPTLDVAAFRLARAGKFDEAFAILRLNEEQFPTSSNLATFRANINLMKGDTAAAISAFREAVRRDSTNGEAQGRLRQLTRP